MNIAILGNPVDGLRFYGPFTTSKDAADWAETQDGGDWWIGELQTAILPGQGTHLESVLNRGDVAHLISEAGELLDSPSDVNPDAPVSEYVRGMSELIVRYAGFTDDEDYKVAIRDRIREAI